MGKVGVVSLGLAFALTLAACGDRAGVEGDGGGGGEASFQVDATPPPGTQTLFSPDEPLPGDPGAPSYDKNAPFSDKFHAYNELSVSAAAGPTRVIVAFTAPFNPGVSGPAAAAQAIAIAAQQNGVETAAAASGVVLEVKRPQFVPQMAMTVDAGALNALYANPNVTNVWPDEPVKVSLAEAGPMIGANVAWANAFTGAGQTVAILDTGVDKTHPFLAGKVVSEACYSSTTAAGYGGTVNGSVSFCPGGVAASVAAGSGVNCNVAYDGCTHGTHVAGIAAGKDPGALGYSGIAKDASVIAVQVFSGFTATDCGAVNPCAMSWSSDQILGLDRVYALRGSYAIAAVNMSLGGGSYAASCDTSALKPSIDNLRAAGIATVIASGNNGYKTTISAPACISTSISVGAVCDNAVSGACATGVGGVASYSNIASFLTLLAPGSLITSSVPGGTYVAWNGTSMATPMVTGAWAVLKQQTPAGTVPTILAKLTATATNVNDTRGGGSVTGLKRINLGTAILSGIATPGTEGDLNGDGKGDIVWRNRSNGIDSVWYMNGATTLSGVRLGQVDVPWVIGGVGDLNGDGKADIVWRNPSTGINSVWYQNGATVTGTARLNSVSGTSWVVGGVGDLNGDGFADIVWRNVNSGVNSVWFMSGAVYLSGARLPTVTGSAWTLVGVGDLNGDGKADVVWRRNNGDNIAWLMNGATRTSTVWLPSVANMAWSISGLSDVNGDGMADILWRNTTGGNVVWFMNGATRTSSAWMTSVADTNFEIVNN